MLESPPMFVATYLLVILILIVCATHEAGGLESKWRTRICADIPFVPEF
jgi:hypothetical protein